MKAYVILTADINNVGGMQAYVAGRVQYLERNHWHPIVLFNGKAGGKPIYSMSVDNLACPFLFSDPFSYPGFLRDLIIERLVLYIYKVIDEQCDPILIESQDSWTAPWAELLAKRLKCKHFCFLCNEKLYRINNYTQAKQPFYDYKAQRGELACISKESWNLLFKDYGPVNAKRNVFFAAPVDPIQDVECPAQLLESGYKWTIAFISRPQKIYFASAINGVSEFSKRHTSDPIRFVVVGDVYDQQNFLLRQLDSAPNVRVVCTGSLVPIPKRIFDVVDIVVAGSGSAIYSALQGKPVIVPDASNGKAIGVLGYDTQDTLYGGSGEYYGYADLFEKILIDRVYDNAPIDLSFAPMESGAANDLQMELISESASQMAWFDFSDSNHSYITGGNFVLLVRCIAKFVMFCFPASFSFFELIKSVFYRKKE